MVFPMVYYLERLKCKRIVGVVRQITSGLTAAYIVEDGDGPDWPDALEEFDAHLRSVSVNKTELADALLKKGVFALHIRSRIAACTLFRAFARYSLSRLYRRR